MNKMTFVAGILVFVYVFGMTVIGCDNDTTKNVKTIAPELIGKWELETMLVNGTPYWTANSVSRFGYEFASNVMTLHSADGESHSASSGIGYYTENNILYLPYGLGALCSYSVSGDKLTLTYGDEDNNDVKILSKVTKFSWE